jgi:hypothetical protein
MHPYVLELSFLDAGTRREAKDKWKRTMWLVRASSRIEPMTLVHEKISIMHDMHDTDFPSRNSNTSFIIPSTAYLDAIDKPRTMPLEEVRDAIREKVQRNCNYLKTR